MNNKILNEIKINPKLISGTIQIFGEWFGKPYDNIHECINVSMINGEMIFDFEGHEKLIVRNPSNPYWKGKSLAIKDASYVEWAWFYYGKPNTEENLFKWVFEKNFDKVESIRQDIRTKEKISENINMNPEIDALIIWMMQ